MNKIKIEFTKAQIFWLEQILGRGYDGCFIGNKRERKLCDDCYKKTAEAMDLLGYESDNPYFQDYLYTKRETIKKIKLNQQEKQK